MAGLETRDLLALLDLLAHQDPLDSLAPLAKLDPLEMPEKEVREAQLGLQA